MTEDLDCDVLIVGLGPVGASLTALLVQRGVRVIALDKDLDPYPLPRAVHFDHEIMRLFQELGLADAVQRHARDLPEYRFITADGQVLMRLSPPAKTPSGWGAGYMFHQPGLEGVLREALTRSPLADLRLGARLEGFSQDDDRVTALIATPDGSYALSSRYIIGCDGAHSAIRQAIGNGLFDYDFDEPWLVVDVKTTPDSTVPEVNLQLCDPTRPTTCVLGGPGRHRWEFMILPGETPEDMATEDRIRALLAPWGCGPVEIERKAVYRFHGLVANRWRSGRAMIAGDAAHQTPPFAGQGLCAGLRDAVNLAWKLDWILRGVAGEALLDTYQVEREPHVRAAIDLAIGMGRMVCTLDPDVAASRDAGLLARQRAGDGPTPAPASIPFASGCILAEAPGAGTVFPQPTDSTPGGSVRMDDALGRDGWLISRTATAGAAPLQACILDDEPLRPFRNALEGWLEDHGVDAVLVRPDRYIFGAGDPDRLLAAWRRSMAPPRGDPGDAATP